VGGLEIAIFQQNSDKQRQIFDREIVDVQNFDFVQFFNHHHHHYHHVFFAFSEGYFLIVFGEPNI